MPVDYLQLQSYTNADKLRASSENPFCSSFTVLDFCYTGGHSHRLHIWGSGVYRKKDQKSFAWGIMPVLDSLLKNQR